MNKNELQLLLKEGESLTVEFKESFSSKLDKDLVAFANTHGGSIFIGVNDQGKIIGATLTNDLKAKINSLARNCEPGIILKSIEQINEVVVITIDESLEKPHTCSTGYYRRLDAATQKMNQKELKLLFKKSEKITPFERLICKDISYDNISLDKIQTFLTMAGISLTQFSVKEILSSLNLVEHNQINHAGVLFFAENPRRYIFHCEMMLVAFKGTDRVYIYDRVNVQDDLISQFSQAMDFLKKHLNVRSEIRGVERYDICEIPLEALREAVVNAIIHRDYSISGTSIMVEVHEDRVVIKNPGGLLPGVSVNALNQISIRRNETIADLFSRVGKAERIGSGIQRIMDLISHANLPEPIIESNLFFSITFKRDPKFKVGGIGLVEGSDKSSDKSSDKIVDNVRKNKKITINQLATELGITERAVEKQLATLKKSGKLIRVGSKKGGHWEIVDQKNSR